LVEFRKSIQYCQDCNVAFSKEGASILGDVTEIAYALAEKLFRLESVYQKLEAG
jgi:hypothetical protein